MNNNNAPVATRFLLKVSGESIGNQDKNNGLYNKNQLQNIAKQIIILARQGYEIAVVIGGGNIWRGQENAKLLSMDNQTADYIGMIATVMNGLALESQIKYLGYDKVNVCSAIEIPKISEPFYYKKVKKRLSEKYIIILSAGVGLPYFTTDTAATLRARQLDIKTILIGKNGVDGVYTSDPVADKTAKHISELTLNQLINLKLKIMDQTASTLAIADAIDMLVFDITKENNIIKVVQGKAIVTKIIGK